MIKEIRRFLYATVLAFTATVLLSTPVYAVNPTWGWGGFTHTNFTTSTVVGMKTLDWPYWQNKVAWSGPDKGIAFVITVFTPYSEGFQGTGNPSFQIALLARQGTKLMDTIYELPGDTATTDICAQCSDGTATHTYEISRISNGWNLYMDGSLEAQRTCSCSNDNVDLTKNQMPIVMEVNTNLLQSDIDGNFQVSEGVTFNYEVAPVGSGTWLSIPHMFAYYTNTGSCTNTQVGSTVPPPWAAAQSVGPVQNVETGTIKYLTAAPCGGQFFTPTA